VRRFFESNNAERNYVNREHRITHAHIEAVAAADIAESGG